MATIDEFKKIELRVGKILSADRIEGSEKLVKLRVSFGALGERQIIAGIGPFFADLATLINRTVAFAYNLDPRTLMGHESQGMILGVGEGDQFSLLSVDPVTSEGSAVR